MSHLSFLGRLAMALESSIKGFANPSRGGMCAVKQPSNIRVKVNLSACLCDSLACCWA